MLEIKNVNVYAGSTRIINNVSFSAQYGELTAVIALNGVGKTQLIKTIANINTLKEGQILIEGNKPEYNGKVISYLPQKVECREDFLCEDYVLMGRAPYINLFGIPSNEDLSVVDHSMKISGVSHLRGRTINSLSGGEFRRVCIAKLLSQNTKVMLLDEPCAYLDCKRQHRIMSLIKKIVKEYSRCAIVTLHDPALAFKFCDKVILMNSKGVESELNSNEPDIDKINLELSKIYGKEIKIRKLENNIILLWNE